MSIEDTLRDALAERLDTLEVPSGDSGRAVREGDARRRRTWQTGLAAAACLALVATGAALLVDRRGTDADPGPAPAAPVVGDWTRLPDPPLSPRANSLLAWTGSEALVLGGETDHLCPPTADCSRAATVARDGAAYHPATQTWRRIATAPVPLASWSRHAVSGDRLVVVEEDQTFVYDASEDAWRSLGGRLAGGGTTALSVLDDRVHALGARTVTVLDVTAGTWSELPESTNTPRLERQGVAATPEGIVVFGVDSTRPDDGVEPSLLLAEVWDGSSWTRLGASEVLGGWGGWHWTGQRLVSPYAECLDGGEVNNYGRCIPTGGALDPGTGTWQTLDPAPSQSGRGWKLSAAEGTRVATWGYVYDDGGRSWTRIERPEDAPGDGTAAAFADGTLIAFGGVTWADARAELSNRAWALTP